MATTQDSPNGEPRLFAYFRAVVKLAASDLHLKADSPPHVRVRGDIVTIGSTPLSRADAESLAMELLSPAQREQFEHNGSIDLACELAGSDRFRINIFRQRGLISLAARRVSRTIPSFADLHLPPVIEPLSELRQGLILVSGITGSGKSTTIAAMIEHINQTRACHVVTLEDPIEYLYVDNKAFINQREVGIDVPDFPAGLKYLMREDPDVVLIGEMRDTETFEAALHAAETGHLVLGTVHASNTVSTINRVLDLFPEEARNQVRQSMVFNLKAIIGLKLMPSIVPDIGRIPAVEVLIVNPVVRKMIDEHREGELMEVIHADRQSGMQDFNASLESLVDREMISLAEALANSPNPNELRMRLKGIRPGG